MQFTDEELQALTTALNDVNPSEAFDMTDPMFLHYAAVVDKLIMECQTRGIS